MRLLLLCGVSGGRRCPGTMLLHLLLLLWLSLWSTPTTNVCHGFSIVVDSFLPKKRLGCGPSTNDFSVCRLPTRTALASTTSTTTSATTNNSNNSNNNKHDDNDDNDNNNIIATPHPRWETLPLAKIVWQQRQREQQETDRRAVTEQQEETRDVQDQFFVLLALVPSIIAFDVWDEISHTLAVFLDKTGAIGRAVDGGQFAVNLLRPTITGVVVPVISIALATLVSTTVNVLRARQVELRALINKEACELRLLRRAVRGMFGTRQHASRRARALALLASYVQQLQVESSVGAVQALEELQLRGGIAVNELEQLSEMLHGVDGAAASRQGSVGVADGLVQSLNGHRSDRVALLLSVFPGIHWGVLVALSLSIIATFLLNSNQQVLQYLNSVQLRALFAILVGVFSGTATLCFDLANPFTGSFSITEASTQLEDLRLCLEQDVAEAAAEAGEISSSLVHAILLGGSSTSTSVGSSLSSYNHNYNENESLPSHMRPAQNIRVVVPDENNNNNNNAVKNPSANLTATLPWESRSTVPLLPFTNVARLRQKVNQNGNGTKAARSSSNSSQNNNSNNMQQPPPQPPQRYGIISTIYFHLLTGPLGSNVRILGDVIAWAATLVSQRTRRLSQRLSRLRPKRSRRRGKEPGSATTTIQSS